MATTQFNQVNPVNSNSKQPQENQQVDIQQLIPVNNAQFNTQQIMQTNQPIPLQQVMINSSQQQQLPNPQQQQMMMQQMRQQQLLKQQEYQEKLQKKQQRIEELKKKQKYPWPDLPANNEKNLDIGGHYQKLMFNCGECCICCSVLCPCVTCCFINYPYITIQQGHQGVYQRFGRYVKTVPAGLQRINPCTDKLSVLDVKMKCLDIRKQFLLTKDNVTIIVDAVVYYKIESPSKAKFFIVNIDQAVQQLTFATMRCISGHFTFQDILEKRQEVQEKIQSFVDDHVWEWGVTIENVVIKDIQMSKELQDTLAVAAREKRLAEAKILSAKADVQTARLFREAADILNSKSAIQIRYLDTIKNLSQTSKVIFYNPDEAQ
eukprot:TRINITY_DN9543_c0_g1_i1.p1 TRINITY_DN9543_c0_g1~~TRINITY_DN9543_c0_g1_i1.p1  ORF type:complete len:376 (+),score=58.85 TRINITY_DN9543_c0_g1_i1:140-1267(+)